MLPRNRLWWYCIYYFENAAQPESFSSIFSSLWWAVTTLTTVGYGDIYPITVGGRIFTFFVLMIGLGIVAVPTGLFASALTEARHIQDEAAKMKKDDVAWNNWGVSSKLLSPLLTSGHNTTNL